MLVSANLNLKQPDRLPDNVVSESSLKEICTKILIELS